MQNNTIYRKVSRGFQVTLPPKFREAAHLDIGATVTMKMNGNKLIIEPCVDAKKEALERFKDSFNELDAKPALADDELAVQKIVAKEIKALESISK